MMPAMNLSSTIKSVLREQLPTLVQTLQTWPWLDTLRTLRALVFASSHPMFAQGGALTAEEVVDVLLDGVIKRAAPC